MTQNLKIQNINLTTADSDTAGNFNLPISNTNGFNNYNISYVYVDPIYGGYYSWYAATAGSGNYQINTQTAPNSICPKNWRIPTGPEFSALVSDYNHNNSGEMLKPPLNFMLGGNKNDGGFAHSQGANAMAWASTTTNVGTAPNFLILNTTSTFGDHCGIGLCGCYGCGRAAHEGMNIRCILK